VDPLCQNLYLIHATFKGFFRACVWVGKGFLVEGAYVGVFHGQSPDIVVDTVDAVQKVLE